MNSISPRESLSSLGTFVYKFIFPPIWIGGIGSFLLAAAVSDINISANSMIILFIALIIVCFLSYRFWLPLKSIQLDEHYLYISNGIKTIQIPISEIKEVTDTPIPFMWTHPAWIKFRIPTKFGSKIIFMPNGDIDCLFGKSHPVVAKLQELSRSTTLLATNSNNS